MGRPKGSKNRPKDIIAAEKAEPKKRGRPKKEPKFDLFASGGVLTLDQEEIVEQEKRFEQIEEVSQELNELDEMDYMLQLAKQKKKSEQVQQQQVKRQQVRYMLGDEWVYGWHCGISSEPNNKGLHIIKSIKPNLLAFMPKSSFEYVD